MPLFSPTNMTSDTAPPPYVLTGSGTDFDRYRAFNGDTTYFAPYQTSIIPAILILDLGAGNAQPIYEYIIKFVAYPDSDTTKAPKDWTLSGSNDNVTYVQMDSQSNVTSWTLDQLKGFQCATPDGVPYRYHKLVVTATNGDARVKFSELFYYNSVADVLLTSLYLVVWGEYIPDTGIGAPHGNGEIFLGDPSHTPGSVTIPGNGDVYLSGAALPKTRLAFTLPLDGTGVVPATQDGADASTAVVWCSILGGVLAFDVPNNFNIYALYFEGLYTDGKTRYSYPSTVVIEAGSGVVFITDENDAIDHDLNTFANIERHNFSGLGIPSYLRISGFGDFVEAPVLGCNNPVGGTVGVAYNHPLLLSLGFAPYVAVILTGALPTGLALVVVGTSLLIVGTPTASGTFGFTVQVTDAIDSVQTVTCSITIVPSGPCPDGTGSQIGPG